MRTAFAHPIQRLVELGTGGYPLRTRRRLKILNAFAALIAVSSGGYALSYTLTDARTYRWIIAINLTLVVMALCVPLLHRVNDILGGLVIAGTEGTIELRKGNSAVAVLDYGTGICDNKATLTVNGTVYEITLH